MQMVIWVEYFQIEYRIAATEEMWPRRGMHRSCALYN